MAVSYFSYLFIGVTAPKRLKTTEFEGLTWFSFLNLGSGGRRSGGGGNPLSVAT